MNTFIPSFGDKYGIQNFLSMKRNPLHFLVAAHQECGEVLTMRVGPYKVTSITDSEHIRYVLKARSDLFPKNTPGYRGMRDYLGRGLLTHPGGTEWRSNSKLLRPLFWPDRINGTDKIISYWVRQYKKDIRDEINNNRELNLTNLFRRLTLSILCDIMFGYTEKNAINAISSDIDTCIRAAFAKLYDPLYWVRPSNIRLERAFRDARQRLQFFSETLLDHTPSDHPGTVLGVYMQSILNRSGKKRIECRDEIITFLQAGHETSSTTLNAVFYRVLSDPSLQRALQNTIDTLPAEERYSTGTLDLVNQCIWESFRFDPSTWAFDRYVSQNDSICGSVPVKKGSFLIISPYVVHRLFSSFTDKARFNPSVNFQSLEDLKRTDNIPFSVGPRNCPGAAMAHKEIRETIIGLLDEFEYGSANTDAIEFKPSITLKLSGDLLTGR